MVCIFPCIITLIIIIIFSSWLIYLWLKNLREKYKIKYGRYTIKYCETIDDLTYNNSITKPPNTNYDYNLARALLEVSLNVTRGNCLNIVPIPNPGGFVSQYRVTGVDPIDGKQRMFATIFTSREKMLMVFTGTFERDEWLSDFDFPQVEADSLVNYVQGTKIHKGFYDIYMSIRHNIWQLFNNHTFSEFYITGHSLGAALATIAAYDFAGYNPINYTFASPRVGNIEFALRFNQMNPGTIRVYNIEDVITEMPPPIIFKSVYQHVNRGIPFNINLGSIDRNHIDSYRFFLPNCVPNIAPCE